MLKIAIVYTGTNEKLCSNVEKAIENELNCDYEILQYQDESIISSIRNTGFVTKAVSLKLMKMYLKAIDDEADIILNVCSSISEVADVCKDIGVYLQVPIIRIDELMCEQAVEYFKNIGVIGTLRTTMQPTMKTLMTKASNINCEVSLVDGLIDGGFDLSEKQYVDAICNKLQSMKEEIDVALFCQASMAYCKEEVESRTGVKVLTSPEFGAISIKRELVKRGLIEETNVN